MQHFNKIQIQLTQLWLWDTESAETFQSCYFCSFRRSYVLYDFKWTKSLILIVCFLQDLVWSSPSITPTEDLHEQMEWQMVICYCNKSLVVWKLSGPSKLIRQHINRSCFGKHTTVIVHIGRHTVGTVEHSLVPSSSFSQSHGAKKRNGADERTSFNMLQPSDHHIHHWVTKYFLYCRENSRAHLLSLITYIVLYTLNLPAQHPKAQ